MSVISIITKLHKYEMVNHVERCNFSSRCSKSQHSMCKGRVSKQRCLDGLCKCPCHSVFTISEKLHLTNYRCKKHDDYFKRLDKQ